MGARFLTTPTISGALLRNAMAAFPATLSALDGPQGPGGAERRSTSSSPVIPTARPRQLTPSRRGGWPSARHVSSRAGQQQLDVLNLLRAVALPLLQLPPVGSP